MLVFFAVEDRSSARLRRGVGFEVGLRLPTRRVAFGVLQAHIGGRRRPALASKDADSRV